MTESPGFEPPKTLVYYAEAGERSASEAFILAIGPNETFRALLRLDAAKRARLDREMSTPNVGCVPHLVQSKGSGQPVSGQIEGC